MVGLAGIAAGSSTDLQAISPETGVHGALNGAASAGVRSIDTGPELKCGNKWVESLLVGNNWMLVHHFLYTVDC